MLSNQIKFCWVDIGQPQISQGYGNVVQVNHIHKTGEPDHWNLSCVMEHHWWNPKNQQGFFTGISPTSMVTTIL